MGETLSHSGFRNSSLFNSSHSADGLIGANVMQGS
jgi:hypothetical protein